MSYLIFPEVKIVTAPLAFLTNSFVIDHLTVTEALDSFTTYTVRGHLVLDGELIDGMKSLSDASEVIRQIEDYISTRDLQGADSTLRVDGTTYSAILQQVGAASGLSDNMLTLQFEEPDTILSQADLSIYRIPTAFYRAPADGLPKEDETIFDIELEAFNEYVEEPNLDELDSQLERDLAQRIHQKNQAAFKVYRRILSRSVAEGRRMLSRSVAEDNSVAALAGTNATPPRDYLKAYLQASRATAGAGAGLLGVLQNFKNAFRLVQTPQGLASIQTLLASSTQHTLTGEQTQVRQLSGVYGSATEAVVVRGKSMGGFRPQQGVGGGTRSDPVVALAMYPTKLDFTNPVNIEPPPWLFTPNDNPRIPLEDELYNEGVLRARLAELGEVEKERDNTVRKILEAWAESHYLELRFGSSMAAVEGLPTQPPAPGGMVRVIDKLKGLAQQVTLTYDLQPEGAAVNITLLLSYVQRER